MIEEKNGMKRTLTLAFALAVASTSARGGIFDPPDRKDGPVKIVFDSDMFEDYDDVGAMAVLHALADAGEAEILATVSCTRDNASVAMIQILNRYYGRPDIPVGCAKKIGVSGQPRDHEKYLEMLKRYPGWHTYGNSDDAPDSVAVYRKTLAAQPNGSVVVCSVGMLTNIRLLLESGADELSPLSGRDLVAKKVKLLVSMCCQANYGVEYNSMLDWISSDVTLRLWPTPIVFSDADYGRHLYCGRCLADAYKGDLDPVKEIFSKALMPREKLSPTSLDQEPGHPAWDQSAVLYAVRGRGNWCKLEPGRYEMVGTKGADKWTYDVNGHHARIVERMWRVQVGKIIDELTMRPPKNRARPKTRKKENK